MVQVNDKDFSAMPANSGVAMNSADAMKRQAAARALTLVRSGMKLGLGTGSTAKHFVDLLGEQVKAGLQVLCVPTSEATRAQAASLNIPLTTLDETPELDLTVDGADEIDGAMNLIKGGGGAHLREKIVASASKRMVVIADESKVVPVLGKFPLPVEVVSFGMAATQRHIEAVLQKHGCAGKIVLRHRADGPILVTDSGHWILDCHCGAIQEPAKLAEDLSQIPGVVEHGLFIGLCSGAIIATATGLRLIGALD